MASCFRHWLQKALANKEALRKKVSWILLLLVIAFSASKLYAQPGREEIQDVTGKYHFLTADDTLALLEEDGKLKGYIDVFQGEEESDEVLSYTITAGWRKKERVEFKTNTIHRMYYRFVGTVQRGKGHERTDPDFLELVGELESHTVKGETGEEAVERQTVVFKSLGKGERPED